MHFHRASVTLSLLLTLGGLTSAQGSGTLISVDFQPNMFGIDFSGNEAVAAGIDPCFNGASTWNHVSVPAYQLVEPLQTNGNFPLVDSTGAATPVRLIVTGDLLGFYETVGGVDDLRNDYLFFNSNAFSNPASTINWRLTGVSPDTAYELVLYGHSGFERTFMVTVDTDGDGSLADETPIMTTPQTTQLPPIRSSASGQILARCEGIGAPGSLNEAAWSGFQLVSASDRRVLDDYSNNQNFTNNKYTWIEVFAPIAPFVNVGPDLQFNSPNNGLTALLWNDGEVLAEVGDRVSIDVRVTGDNTDERAAGLYLSDNLGVNSDSPGWVLLDNLVGSHVLSIEGSPYFLSGTPTGPAKLTVELLEDLGGGALRLRAQLVGPGFSPVDEEFFHTGTSSSLFFGPAAFNVVPGESTLDNFLYEAGGLEATLAETNGTGINLNIQATPKAILGQPWSSTIIVGEPSAPAAGFLLLFFHPNVLTTPITVSLLGGPFTELLIGPSPLALPCGIGSYAGPFATACAGVVIPNDCSLVGVPWATQVAVGSPGAGYALTNASYGIVGTR